MNLDNELTYKVRIGEPEPLGTSMKGRKSINIALMAQEDKKYSLIIYKKGSIKVATEIPFTEDMRFGNIYAMEIEGIPVNEFEYAFRADNMIIQDPFAKVINGASVWGEEHTEKSAGVYHSSYDWQGDKPLNHPFEESVIYRLHVRGFTKSKYSKARCKGTFKGLMEKIPYLKELGITMVELMPAYEFDEMQIDMFSSSEPRVKMAKPDKKINYWGYCQANYFAPKSAYAWSKTKGGAIKEFKDMIKEFHRNDIEVAMEFYFDESINPHLIYQCFRFWVKEYHIDGIHCNVNSGISDMIQRDPYLSRTKLMRYGWNDEKLYGYKHLAEYNDTFMDVTRCFLKGDEGRVADMAFRMRYNPNSAATINYIASNDTLSLYDTVSYSRCHNEDNGEDNRDGRRLNYNWNCGFEGDTKRKAVVTLRQKQMKNAFALLLLSQGTPMIYAGDEFGHSCGGNNNPYCQDNETSWTNWRLLRKNNELFTFVKDLIAYRKEHPILHLSKQMSCKDHRAFGMPDMSYHSEKTWTLDTDNLTRHFGVMLYGKYSRLYGYNGDCTLFFGINMHWEEQRIGVPRTKKNQGWEVVFNTSVTDNPEIENRMLVVPPRSIVVLECVKVEENDEESDS